MTIYFYSALEEPYGVFSNFSPHGFVIDGIYYKTNEHYFQAMKFYPSQPDIEAVLRMSTPKLASSVGRDRDRPLRTDWEQVKDDVMRNGVFKKFETHADLRELLLSTGTQTIMENAPGDYYWGTGADGTGQNRLGQILMEVREILRENNDYS